MWDFKSKTSVWKIGTQSKTTKIINAVRSDDFWTGKIPKSMLTDEMIEFIKFNEYWDRGINSYLSTNSMHFCLT